MSNKKVATFQMPMKFKMNVSLKNADAENTVSLDVDIFISKHALKMEVYVKKT